jgi:mono/diheme cytochrome c family protein
MGVSRTTTGLALAALALGAAALGGDTLGQARADAAPAAGPAQVGDFMLADQNLLAKQLYRMSDAKAVVILTYARGDVALRADAAALMALKAAYAPKGVEFLALDSTLGDQREPVIADAKAAGLDLPILFDYEQLVGEELGVTRAAEAIVVDPRNWSVAYRGPVAGLQGEPWLSVALADLAAGRKVTMPAQAARGGVIAFPERAHAASFAKISYAQTVAPIIQAKCATCHQPGGVGPMALNTYEQIKGFSPMIREVIRTHRMPPYLADETVGQFRDDDRLTPQQMKTLVHWIDAGAPRGAGEDPLKKIKFQASEWPLGKPDLILNVPPAKVPASGVLEYQHPVVENKMAEGRWMKATTFRISDRAVVHHILTGVVPESFKPGDQVSEAQWGASLGGYGPGRGSNIQPVDTGVWVPPSGGVAFQNHYTPYGRETTENTQMGIYFYKKGEEPKYILRTFLIADFSIEIPANTEEHHEIASVEFPNDAILYGITPHAHKRGTSTSLTIRYPDGHEKMLIALPRYDFNWQYEYFLKAPLKIPAGSKIIARWTYDNSSRNPANAEPGKTVHWGEQTTDEMFATYLHYRWADETVAKPRLDHEKALQGNLLFGVLDDNIDGKLQVSEMRGQLGDMLKKYLPLIDTNKDGMIDPAEWAAAQKLLPKSRRGGGGATPAPAAEPTKTTAAGGGSPPGGR